MAAKERTQDEKNLKTLRELAALSTNKHCFDCRQRGPTYVNVTIGSFVCTSCSGLLRGLNPPHRVKSITMAKFTPEEIDLMKIRGNEYCRCVWLGKSDPRSSVEPEMQSVHRVREYMIQKYEEKKWYVEPEIAIKQLHLQQQQTSVVQETKAPASFTVKQPVQSNQGSRSASWSSVSSTSAFHSQGKTDAFAEFGSDPFLSSAKPLSGVSSSSDTFADFSIAFDNAAPNSSSSLPVIHPSATTAVQFATSFASVPSFSATTLPDELPSPPISKSQTVFFPPSADRYAALADLDSQLHSQLTQHQPTVASSSTIPSLWSGSNTTLYGGPTVLGSHSVYGAADKSNPFRDTTSTWSQTSLISSANPFQTASQPAAVPGFSPYAKPPLGGSQFATSTTSSLQNGDSNQLGLENGGLGTSPWSIPSGTVPGWGSGSQNGQLDIFQSSKNHGVENLNPWTQQPPANPIVANPFMNGTGTTGLPTSGLQTNPTNNPFL